MTTTAENPFPVVGLGGSAGGLSALTQLIGALPPQPGLALVVVQHLDPHNQSRLGELLQPHTAMTVVDAVHGVKVAPNHVYVIQPNTNLAIADGVLSVTPRPDDRRPHYPVDHFLRSLATVQGPHAVGVILSGTGSDGTLGICEIKAAGGLTFAQEEQSAQHAGMPQSAIASGAVDLVLPPKDIAARLTNLLEHPYLATTVSPEHEFRDEAEEFQRVITALRRTTGRRFQSVSGYHHQAADGATDAAARIHVAAEVRTIRRTGSREAEALYRDVLINVTSFFRDPDMFDALKAQVFPAIVRGKAEGTPIRVWVPGCSTGQEAYSIAMVLLEYLDTVGAERELQIFATDLGDPTDLGQGPCRGVSGKYRGGSQSRAAPALLYQGESHVSHPQERARPLRLCPPERDRGPTVLARRSHHLPQRADLHVPAAAGTAAA